MRIAGAFYFCLCATALSAAPSPSASPASSAKPAGLTSAEMAQAIKTDDLTIPTPAETFAALGKPAKPDWTASFRGPIAMNYKTRAQIALNLGGLIADGFIAVEAQDSQQVKNIGGDILRMAKSLGVSQNILARGNSINQFAENDEWPALQEELEATQNEVKASMQSHRDQDLVILVSLGGWIRGAQVVCNVVAKNYDEKLAQVLRQPELVKFIHAKLSQVSPELQSDPLVKTIDGQLEGVEKLVGTPFGKSLTAAEVKQLQTAINQLMQEIGKKDG
jgi:hypothetical protein